MRPHAPKYKLGTAKPGACDVLLQAKLEGVGLSNGALSGMWLMLVSSLSADSPRLMGITAGASSWSVMQDPSQGFSQCCWCGLQDSACCAGVRRAGLDAGVCVASPHAAWLAPPRVPRQGGPSDIATEHWTSQLLNVHKVNCVVCFFAQTQMPFSWPDIGYVHGRFHVCLRPSVWLHEPVLPTLQTPKSRGASMRYEVWLHTQLMAGSSDAHTRKCICRERQSCQPCTSCAAKICDPLVSFVLTA